MKTLLRLNAKKQTKCLRSVTSGAKKGFSIAFTCMALKGLQRPVDSLLVERLLQDGLDMS